MLLSRHVLGRHAEIRWSSMRDHETSNRCFRSAMRANRPVQTRRDRVFRRRHHPHSPRLTTPAVLTRHGEPRTGARVLNRGGRVRVVLVPPVTRDLIARAGAAPVGGRNPTAPLVGCRRSTLVAESLRRSSVPVAPGPVALPLPPAAPDARGEPTRPRLPGTVLPKTRLLQRIIHPW